MCPRRKNRPPCRPVVGWSTRPIFGRIPRANFASVDGRSLAVSRERTLRAWIADFWPYPASELCERGWPIWPHPASELCERGWPIFGHIPRASFASVDGRSLAVSRERILRAWMADLWPYPASEFCERGWPIFGCIPRASFASVYGRSLAVSPIGFCERDKKRTIGCRDAPSWGVFFCHCESPVVFLSLNQSAFYSLD
jgi:hypothetical protein